MSFQKLQSKILNYRDYTSFDNEKFWSDIWKMNLNAAHVGGFMKTVFRIFIKHAPIKRKYFRVIEAPFMTKDLHKAVMKRSKLRSKFLKSRKLSDRKNYTSQRTICKKTVKELILIIQILRKLLITKHFGKLSFHSFLSNSRKARK